MSKAYNSRMKISKMPLKGQTKGIKRAGKKVPMMAGTNINLTANTDCPPIRRAARLGPYGL